MPLLRHLRRWRDGQARARAIQLDLQLFDGQPFQVTVRMRNARSLAHPRNLPRQLNVRKWALAVIPAKPLNVGSFGTHMSDERVS